MHPEELRPLLAALAAIYAAEDREPARQSARALLEGQLIAPFGPEPAGVFDVAIRALAADPAAHPAAATLAMAQPFVPWGVNPVEDQLTGAAAEVCAVSTLLGPEGPIFAPDLRLGLFYQRPDSYYALHNHDADETYVILAGRALWTAGDDIRWRGPGEAIHHPSRMPHAFRTGPEGFLAAWRWSGDVNTHSYTFLPDPEDRAA